MREAIIKVMIHTADKIIKIIAKPYLSAIIPAIIAKSAAEPTCIMNSRLITLPEVLEGAISSAQPWTTGRPA